MFMGYQAGIDLHSAFLDRVVMIAFAVGAPPELDDLDMSSCYAVRPWDLLESYDTMRDALKLHVISLPGSVIEKQDSGVTACEKVFEG
jgi:hypothetical protein